MELWHYGLFFLFFFLLGVRAIFMKEKISIFALLLMVAAASGYYFYDDLFPSDVSVAKVNISRDTVASSGSVRLGKKKASEETSPSKTGVKLDPKGKVSVDRPKHSFSIRRSDLPENDYEPGEVLIAGPDDELSRQVLASGFLIYEQYYLKGLSTDILRLRAPPGMSVPDAIEKIREISPKVLVDANHRFRTAKGAEAAQGSALRRHARAMMGWPKAPDTCGAGIRIGMIDTPVDVTHPALEGQKTVYKSFVNGSRISASGSHGTAVAAMLIGKNGAQDWGGLLPGATLYAANIFEEDSGRKTVGDAVALSKSLDWIIEQKVHAVNLGIVSAENRVMEELFKKARLKGLTFVAAAGNWGNIQRKAYPAAYGGILAVTAVDEEMQVFSKASTGNFIDFSAPGVGIWTAVPGGGRIQSGTSFAVPYVTSHVAVVMAEKGKVGLGDLRKILRKNDLKDLGEPGKDKVFGYGLIQKPPSCKN